MRQELQRLCQTSYDFFRRLGYVYLICEEPELDAEVVHYKVGRTNNFRRRRSNLQCGNPRKLERSSLVRVYRMTEAERAAKEALREYKCDLVGGTEWFTASVGGEEDTLVTEFEAAVARFEV